MLSDKDNLDEVDYMVKRPNLYTVREVKLAQAIIHLKNRIEALEAKLSSGDNFSYSLVEKVEKMWQDSRHDVK